MAGKRKRLDRTPSDGGRPSPHRPGDTSLGQHDRDDASRGRGLGRQRSGYNHRRDSSQGSSRGGQGAQHNGSPSVRRNSGQNMPPPSSPAPSQPTKPVPPTPTTDAAPVVDPKNVFDYRHDNLTDDRLRSWADRGRKQVVEHGIQSREDEDITELSNLFQEFIHAVLTEKLEPKDAGACVRDILGTSEDSDSFAPVTLFIDSLAIIVDSRPNQYLPSLRDFLIATEISVNTIRQVLDAQVLQQLGLTRDNFLKKGVRFSTNHLYRQANFNLLREESEGYAKLITELYTTSDVLDTDMPKQTFEKIKALIGTFDLDVGRALDVTLDVAAAVLVKQFKFFVRLLRISSWWPKQTHKVNEDVFTGGLPNWALPDYPSWSTSEEDEAINAQRKLARDISFWDRVREVHLTAFFELGGRRPSADSKLITNGVDDAQAMAQQSWIDITGTVPPSGNYVAAQLLGFKLLFYYSETRDPTDVLPANLLYLAALLIKIGFISVTDIWPHLSPSDDKMELVREKRLREIDEEERKKRGGGQMNALLMAGALPQDDEPTNAAGSMRREASKAADADSKQQAAKDSLPKLDEPHEQKVSLLIQLLTIGAIPEALFILGRFPWIPEVAPEVLDGIHRILHVCIDKVYRESRPIVTKHVSPSTKPVVDVDQSGMPRGSVRLAPLTTKKFLKWPTPDRNDHNDAQDYRYYWDEWTDNVPVCQNVDDIFTLCDSFLNVSGVNIGRDESLLAKMATIGQKSLHDDTSDANLERWKSLLRRILLPALSHTQANASVANAIWLMLKRYPMTVRYSLYAEWFEGPISRLPAMRGAFQRAQADTRATMKRVSLTNLPEMARRLAKTSYSSPGIVFRVAFEQLEVYSNLIDAIVECAKYFTELSYDVLVWSLMNSLGKSRSRTQAEHALTTSKWLQALSKFTGKVYRRYRDLSPAPVVQYVNHQLVEGNSTDLIILKDLITSMGGIVDQTDFTDAQIYAMAGGEWLRQQTLLRAGDKRMENERAAQRFVHALTEADLAGVLLINLTRFRQGAIFQVPEDEAHIKYLSSIVDDTHQILVQYLDFLWSNLDTASYDRAVLPIPDLIHKAGLDVSLAFLIGRASLSARMFPWKKDQAAIAEPEKDGDTNMSGIKASEGNETASQEAVGDDEQKSNDPSQIQTVLQPVVESVRDAVPPEVWQKISPDLYVIFWALQLSDLFVPDAAYKRERDRLSSEENSIKLDRSNMTKKGMEAKHAQRKRLLALSMDIFREQKEHTLRQGRWRVFLSKQFQTSFPEPRSSPESIADALLEQCFLPRLLLSPADAEYTYKFIRTLHECNAPGFKYMTFCERLFNANRLRTLIFTCSTREAEYLGRFLKLVLEDLARWHKNDPSPTEKEKSYTSQRDRHADKRLGAYEKEAKGTGENPRLGFATEFDENGKPKAFVEHADFRDLLFKWHRNFYTALKSCLAGTEWMHIRNTLTVLKSVLDVYPAIDFMGNHFSQQLQTITEREAASKTAQESEEAHRVDLSVAAQGALSELQRKKSKWMLVQAFRPNTAGNVPAEQSKAAELRATAPEFKPHPARAGNAKISAADAEDGEVADGKSKSTGAAKEDKTSAETLPPKPVGRDVSRREHTPSGTPRSSTPKPNHAATQSALKNESKPNTLPDRPPHNLPTRPDVPIPGHFSERHGQGRSHERREGREPRDPRGPRDGPRDSSRDHHEPRDARGDARNVREHRDPRDNWPNSVEWNDREREHAERRTQDVPPRDASRPDRPELASRHPPGHDRERPPPRDSSRRGGYEQSKESLAAAPPQPTPSAPTPEPTINPGRLQHIKEEQAKNWGPRGQHPEPPNNKGRRQGTGDVENNNPPERPSLPQTDDAAQGRLPLRDDSLNRSRNQSPRRSGRTRPDQPPTEQTHDSRAAPRTHAADVRASGHDPRDRSPLPSSYRGERAMERPNERGHNDGPRDHNNFKRPVSREDHEYRTHEESSYGRLNAIEPMNEAPSGPRGRGRVASARAPLGPHPMPPRQDNRFGPHDQPERTPPTGPAGGSGRGRRFESHGGPPPHSQGPMHPNQMRSFSTGAPMTPTAPGVHPDRLRQVEQQNQAPPPPPPPPGGPSVGGGQGRHSMGGNSTMTPERPPRVAQQQQQQQQQQPPPAPNAATTTPATSRESTARDRHIAINNINNIMAGNKTSEPSTRTSSSRSRTTRPTLANSDVQVLTGASPATTPMQERQDPMRHSDYGYKHTANGESTANYSGTPTTGRGDEHDRGRRDRDGRGDRPSRSSRRSSRDRDRERSPAREKESKDHRDYRERRSGAGQDGREDKEREPSRRSSRTTATAGKESSQPPPPRDSGRESGRHHRGGESTFPKGGGEDWSSAAGGGGSGRQSRGGGVGGGSSTRDGGVGGRSDDRRDSGRKRRTDEQGNSGMMSDREKRPRR